MKIIAIEEHFETPMHREKLPPSPRHACSRADGKERLGHAIDAELLDLSGSPPWTRPVSMCRSVHLTMPGWQAFGTEIAVPMASDANNRIFAAVTAHPTRFAGFAALPTADSSAAVKELERSVKRLASKAR